MRYTIREEAGASKIIDAAGNLAAVINDESLLWMLAETMQRERHELVRESDGAFLAGGPAHKWEN